MNNRTLFTLTGVLIATFALLFIIKFIEMTSGETQAKYIAYNDVRGSSIDYKGLAYTLNFEQQNTLLLLLNQAESAPKGQEAKEPAAITKIVIYRFGNNPDIVIKPLGYVDGNLLFNAPLWKKDGSLIEKSGGKLKALLENAHDK